MIFRIDMTLSAPDGEKHHLVAMGVPSKVAAQLEDLTVNTEMPVVVLVGTPYERGLMHGSRFRTEIAAILDRDLRGLPAQQLSAARNRAAGVFERINNVAPQVAEELAGIAEGAKRTVPEIVLRCGFELLKPIGDTGCSAVAARTNSGAIAAQNWDGPPSKQADLALFLHIAPDGFQFAVVDSFGSLGAVGMNCNGLALVNTDLLLEGARAGIPSRVVRRLVLAMPDVKSAARRLAELPHMAGRAYLIADRAGEVAAVEVSARSGANFLPASNVFLHTNNALLPDTRAEEDQRALSGTYPSSAARLSAMQAAVACDKLSVGGVMKILRDESGAPDAVCKTASANEPSETAFSIVMDCSRGDLHLAAGKPSENAYRKIVLPTC